MRKIVHYVHTVNANGNTIEVNDAQVETAVHYVNSSGSTYVEVNDAQVAEPVDIGQNTETIDSDNESDGIYEDIVCE